MGHSQPVRRCARPECRQVPARWPPWPQASQERERAKREAEADLRSAVDAAHVGLQDDKADVQGEEAAQDEERVREQLPKQRAMRKALTHMPRALSNACADAHL
eukprot:942982-Alexandrium_andersonii.AAC.1